MTHLDGRLQAQTRRARPGREFLIGVAVLCATLVLILLLGEITIRCLEPGSDNHPLYVHYDNSARRWGYLPNRTVLRNGVTVHTNSYGQRGEDYPLEKPPGTFRIVSLGDSYALGSGVPYDDTYARVLEKLLNGSRAADSLRFQALNFGVEGYNTVQELAWLQEGGLKAHPDLILLEYLFNDVDDNTTPQENVGGAQAFVRGRGATHFITTFKQHSRFFAFVSPRLGALLRKTGVKRTGLVGYYVDKFVDGDPGWKRSRDALLEINALARANGARFAVAVFPAMVSLGRANYPLLQYHRVVTDFCREHDIPVLDLYPSFEGKNAARFWMSLTDPHPNAEANHIIGQALYQYLTSQHLVPGPA